MDYVRGEQQFGQYFYFHKLFEQLEALPCVKDIYELSVTAQKSPYAIQKGQDIKPANCCLLYPGEISLEIYTIEE